MRSKEEILDYVAVVREVDPANRMEAIKAGAIIKARTAAAMLETAIDTRDKIADLQCVLERIADAVWSK